MAGVALPEASKQCEGILKKASNKSGSRVCSRTSIGIFNGEHFCNIHKPVALYGKQAPFKPVITAETKQTVDSMVEATMDHKFASFFVENAQQKEVSFFWSDQSLKVGLMEEPLFLKAKADGLSSVESPSKNPDTIYDFKTVGEFGSNPARFERGMVEKGYLRQAAFYREGFRAVTGGDLTFFIFILVERIPPFEVSVLEVNGEDMDRASEVGFKNPISPSIKSLKQAFCDCVNSNQFTGNTDSTIVPIRVPAFQLEND